MNLTRLVGCVLRVGPDIVKAIITYWPGSLGNFLRYWYYKGKLKNLGKKAVIDFGVHITNPSQISIGDNTHIDRCVTLLAGISRVGNRRVHYKANPKYQYNEGEIHIGRNIHIAPYVYIVGAGGIDIGDCGGIASGTRVFSVSNHYCNLNEPDDKKLYCFSNRVPEDEQLLIVGPVVMERNTGVGLNSVVLPGSTIGENSWVGAISCVIGTIPPNVIAGGCPAKIIKHRT
jgi:galactoside O-acetyltransferase